MRALTDNSVIATWETCNESMSIGLLRCINDFSICSLRLPKADILHY